MAHDEVAIQLSTSGTTGMPKGVTLTNWNLGAPFWEGKERQIG